MKHSITQAFAPGRTCQGHCDPPGHVCEDHSDQPWEHDDCGAAGMPCNDPACGFDDATLEARAQGAGAPGRPGCWACSGGWCLTPGNCRQLAETKLR